LTEDCALLNILSRDKQIEVIAALKASASAPPRA